MELENYNVDELLLSAVIVKLTGGDSCHFNDFETAMSVYEVGPVDSWFLFDSLFDKEEEYE